MKESRQIPQAEKYSLPEAGLQIDFLQEIADELGVRFTYWHFQEVSRLIKWSSLAFLKDYHQREFASLIGVERFGPDPDPGPQAVRQASGREKLVQKAASIMEQATRRFSAKENLVSAQAYMEEATIQDEYETCPCPFKGGRFTDQLTGFLAWAKGNLWGLHILEKMNNNEAITSVLTHLESLTIASWALTKASEKIAGYIGEDDLRARWLFFLDLAVRWGYLDFESKGGYLFASLSEVESKLLGRHTLDKIAEGTLIREQYRHSKRDLERSRERLKFYGQYQDTIDDPQNPLGVVYRLHYGLTQDQKRVSRDELSLRYGVNNLTIKDWISFFEYWLRHPDIQNADSDLFRQRERKYPVVLEFLNKRRLELIRKKREELESMSKSDEWKLTYRSLGVLEFDLFLLRSMEDLLLRGVAYYPATEEIARRAELLLRQDYLGCQIKVGSNTIQERIGFQTGILSRYDQAPKKRHKVIVPGLEIINVLEARDLLAACRSGNFSRMAYRRDPSAVIYKRLNWRQANYREEARKLGIDRIVFTSFTDIAIVNLLVSNLLTEKDLQALFDPKRYFTSFSGRDDPRSCRSKDDSEAELKRSVETAIVFVLRKVDSFKSLRKSLIRRFANLYKEGKTAPHYFEMYLLEAMAGTRISVFQIAQDILGSQGIVVPRDAKNRIRRGLPLRVYDIVSDVKTVLLTYYFRESACDD